MGIVSFKAWTDMTDILEAVFGSKAKARMIRFFLLNPDQWFESSDVALKNKLNKAEVRRIVTLLCKIKFLTQKSQKRKFVYACNRDFPFYSELFNLISAASRYPQCQSLKRIREIGDVRLVMASGVFLNYPKGKADLLVVANNVVRKKLTMIMEQTEAEIGKEVRYVLLDMEEFKYRMEMIDRFLMDFFEGPHEEILNKIPNLKRFKAMLKR